MAKGEKGPTIKAYHQVGTEGMAKGKKAAVFDIIANEGLISPAIKRVERGEMWEECYGDTYTERILDKYGEATPYAIQALERLADGWLKKLPEKGSRSTNFNCRDMIAGDFNRIFLSFTDFYYIGSEGKTGFVFDALELIRRGASFRPRDLLGLIDQGIDAASRYEYKSVEEAAAAIERRIAFELADQEILGEEALRSIEECVSGTGDYEGTTPGCYAGELVWQGALSLSLAKEAWRNGKRVRI
jgi:hypothetical protein